MRGWAGIVHKCQRRAHPSMSSEKLTLRVTVAKDFCSTKPFANWNWKWKWKWEWWSGWLWPVALNYAKRYNSSAGGLPKVQLNDELCWPKGCRWGNLRPELGILRLRGQFHRLNLITLHYPTTSPLRDRLTVRQSEKAVKLFRVARPKTKGIIVLKMYEKVSMASSGGD